MKGVISIRNRLRTIAVFWILVFAALTLSGCFSKAVPKEKVQPPQGEKAQTAPVGKVETVTLEVTGIT